MRSKTAMNRRFVSGSTFDKLLLLLQATIVLLQAGDNCFEGGESEVGRQSLFTRKIKSLSCLEAKNELEKILFMYKALTVDGWQRLTEYLIEN